MAASQEYDYFSQGRFRHGSRFLRWRPEKKPASCTFDQLLPAARQKSRKSLRSFLQA
jgi:ATP-dependent DNA ligase